VAALGGSQSEKERQRIVLRQQEELNALEKSLDIERKRQADALAEKLAAVRVKRRAAKHRAQEGELRALLSEASGIAEPTVAEVDAKQMLERELLDRAHEVEVDEALEEMWLELADKRNKAMHAQDEARMKAQSGRNAEKERAKILAKYERETTELSSSLELERARQEKMIRDKVEAKKRRKAEEQAKKHGEAKRAAMAAAQIKADTEARGADGAGGMVAVAAIPELGVPEVRLDDEETQGKEAAMRAEQERLRKELIEKHEQARQALERELKEEASGAERELVQEMEDRKAQLLAERQNKMNAELAARGEELNGEERSRVMNEHQDELRMLENTLDTERSRQAAMLKMKLEAKKKRKLSRLNKEQSAEIQAEMSVQEKENEEMTKRAVRGAERKAILSALETVPVSRAREIR